LTAVALLQTGAAGGECGPAAGLKGRQVYFLVARTQVQVALQEQTRQFPRPVLSVLLHLVMGPTAPRRSAAVVLPSRSRV